MIRLMWLAFFCHVVFFVLTHGGLRWIGDTLERDGVQVTGFELAHDRAVSNGRRRAEQLAHGETEVGRKMRELNDRARILKMMQNEVRR